MVTMSQNMLPFEPNERARFGLSFMRLKLWILELSQTSSFRRAKGLIFLTEYARKTVSAKIGSIRAQTKIVAHGIEDRFRAEPKAQSSKTPFRLLYFSIIDVYKHQCEVATAVANLRKKGVAVTVEFVGGAYAPALREFEKTTLALDLKKEFIHYKGLVDFESLHSHYKQADGFIFASSCENLPNILIEAMSAGLPIACSEKGPMPEVLGQHGVYFNPDEVSSIETALQTLIGDPELRKKWAKGAYEESKKYSWERCAKETFDFISDVSFQYAHYRLAKK